MVSTFEAFVLFLYMFRNGLASNMASYEEWWGMSEPTLRRLYITFLHAVATIMGRHQSWPTYEAARQAVPDKTKSDLDATAEAAIFIGDATELRVSRLRCPSGFIFFSDYKQFTSLKYNGICACNTYLCVRSRVDTRAPTRTTRCTSPTRSPSAYRRTARSWRAVSIRQGTYKH